MDLTGRVVYPKVCYARVGPVEPYVLYERVAVLIAVVDAKVRVVVVGRGRVRRVGHVDVARHGILLDYRRLYVPHMERARNVVDAVAVGAGLAVRMVGALRVRFARRANGRDRCRHEQRGDRQRCCKQASRPGGPPRAGAMRHPPPRGVRARHVACPRVHDYKGDVGPDPKSLDGARCQGCLAGRSARDALRTRTATPLRAVVMTAAGTAARPTAITRPPKTTAASEPGRTPGPHDTTCPQKTDLPAAANGADSASTSTQCLRNGLPRARPAAILTVTASPPSGRAVQSSAPSAASRTDLTRPVLLDLSTSRRRGSLADAPRPNSASTVRATFAASSTRRRCAGAL